MKYRVVWSALIMSLMINLVYTMPNNYTMLAVAMGVGIKAATRIKSLFDFVIAIWSISRFDCF